MPLLLLLALLLCSCSPRPADNTGLPNYSDMSAAEDAGRTPASSPARPETGGGQINLQPAVCLKWWRVTKYELVAKPSNLQKKSQGH